MTALSEPRDRVKTVTASTAFNGIDFVEVVAPRTLHVHFLNTVAVSDPHIKATIDGGDSVPVVPLKAIDSVHDWSSDAEHRPLLTLTALADGDFSLYRLTITAANLDVFLATSTFSFKAGCPSDFDCAPPPHVCPADDTPVPPIDYLAKDFLSFRQALTEFSSLRYPGWLERSEADFGMMMAEVLSALGDELSYLQDRVAAEAALPTATQRRSLVSLARLVDYEPQPAISATTTLLCTVQTPGGSATVPAGTRVSALTPDGSPVPFEIGDGLADKTAYAVSDKVNFGSLLPYWFDDSQQCWPVGSTDMWVRDHGFNLTPGTALLIQTDLPGESVRQIVTLTMPGVETVDPLFLTGGAPTPITHIMWGPGDALTRAHDLTRTTLGGNLLPATQGQRFRETFAIGAAPPSAPDAVLAIARRGPNGSDSTPNYVFRYPLANAPLGWLAQSDPTQPPQLPEIDLQQVLPAARPWTFATSLLKASETSPDFTIDPVAWRAVARTPTGVPTQYEIDGDQGSTVRFGNGAFGALPAEQDLFAVTYRTGLGATGNVAADTITMLDASKAGVLTSARNPFAVTNGADAETADHIRRMAPQAFQAVQDRAVLPSDYQAAAESLPWVEKAGTSFRWTGSWLTVFTAVDPRAGKAVGIADHLALVELLDRRRLAGYESYAPAPQYLSLDLKIEVCVDEGWLDGDVEAAVLNRLGSATRADDSDGFFFADRFTFGTPLYRSRLEAAIQGVPGVAGVHAITYRQRGTFADFTDLPEVVAPAPAQILRVDNDPSWPERGTIRVIPEGGR